jgi:glycosyltransferase involved in cell wall biosynthesis
VKILYLCPDQGIPVLGRKGAAVHVRGLVTAFGRAGHAVILAAPALSHSPWEEPARLEAQLLHLPPSSDALATVLEMKAFNEALGVANSLPSELRRILYNQELGAQLRRRFSQEPPDFIYERASLYATCGVSLARDLGVPLLVELNAPLALEQSTYRATGLGELAAQAERWMLSRADAVMAVSATLRDYVISFGVEPGRVHVLPNGIDPALFEPSSNEADLLARWGLGDELIIGFVGGLRPWHGADTLPRLLEHLAPGHPRVRLVIVGDGPLRGQLQADLRQRGLGERVLFTGSLPHNEAVALMRRFDVAVAPYRSPDHPFYFSPLKVFEYMACGLPLVAPRLGQIAEVVCDGQTGLLYPPDDFDALVQGCDRLLADESLRRHLGQAAAKEVHSRYTWDQNATRVAEVARSLLSTPQEAE